MMAASPQYDYAATDYASAVTVPETWEFDPFTQWLAQSEAFVWVGRPDRDTVVRLCKGRGLAGRYASRLRLIAAAAIPAFVVLETIGTTRISLTVGIIGTVTLGLSLLLNWLNSTLARERANTTYYAVTNQRILICTKEWYTPPIRVAMPVTAAGTYLEEEPDQSGSIQFDCPSELVDIDLEEKRFHVFQNSFACIPAVRQVRDLICKTRTLASSSSNYNVVDEERDETVK